MNQAVSMPGRLDDEGRILFHSRCDSPEVRTLQSPGKCIPSPASPDFWEVHGQTSTPDHFQRMRRERPDLASAFDDFILRVLADRIDFANHAIDALNR
jgi:hypothetical protein